MHQSAVAQPPKGTAEDADKGAADTALVFRAFQPA